MKRLFGLAVAAMALFANAQTFPGAKPITLVVPAPAGSLTDHVARDLADAMRKSMGSGAHFVVENLNGAGGTLGATKVAKAAPNGYTLLVHHIGMASTPALYRRLPYQTLEDFEYLGLINEVPMMLIGKRQLPANNYREFESHIRANAGQLNMAHAGLGSASHLCGLMWQSAIKTPRAMSSIPFGGAAPAMNALIGGQVDLMCDQTSNATGQIEAGRIKAFAVTSTQRLSNNKLLRDYPTLQEMGLKGFSLTIWHGLYAPKGTPPAVLAQLNDALKQALKEADFIKKEEALDALVVNDPRVEPAAHKAFVAGEIAKLKPVIEASGQFAD